MINTFQSNSIIGILKLLNVLWNHEPSFGEGKLDSNLPTEINHLFWIINDIDEDISVLQDIPETESQIKWAKNAWE